MAAKTELTAGKIIAVIAEGRMDGNLADILTACQKRVGDGKTAFYWSADYDGVRFTEQDVTLDELDTAERLSGRNWSFISPAASAGACRALFTAVLIHRHNLTEQAAKDRVASWPVDAVLQGIGQYEVTGAPFEDGGDGATST